MKRHGCVPVKLDLQKLGPAFAGVIVCGLWSRSAAPNMWSLDRKHQHHGASSGNLLQMQIHRPHVVWLNQKICRCEAQQSVLGKHTLKVWGPLVWILDIQNVGHESAAPASPGTCYKCIIWAFPSDLLSLRFTKPLVWVIHVWEAQLQWCQWYWCTDPPLSSKGTDDTYSSC